MNSTSYDPNFLVSPLPIRSPSAQAATIVGWTLCSPQFQPVSAPLDCFQKSRNGAVLQHQSADRSRIIAAHLTGQA